MQLSLFFSEFASCNHILHNPNIEILAVLIWINKTLFSSTNVFLTVYKNKPLWLVWSSRKLHHFILHTHSKRVENCVKLSRRVSIQRRLLQRLKTWHMWRKLSHNKVFITKKKHHFTSHLSLPVTGNSTRGAPQNKTSPDLSNWVYIEAELFFTSFTNVFAVTGVCVCVCTQNAFVVVKSWLCGMKPRTKLLKIRKTSIKWDDHRLWEMHCFV